MTVFDEEPWEAEIGQLLGGLPSIDPPDGFIDRALDHRPLHAGRIVLGLMAVALASLVAVTATGTVGRGVVAPELAVLSERHDAVTAGSGTGLDLPPASASIETGVRMPAGFERTGDYAGDDLEFAIYQRGSESVSVAVQDGRVDWDALPPGGLTTMEGQRAWVDRDLMIVIVEADSSAVTIIGLSAEEVASVLATVPRREPSTYDRLEETVSAIVGQFGFPSVG